MLPGFLDSAYKKYKNDTSIFIQWLSDNGQKCGYTLKSGANASRPLPGAASVKTARLKGKARKAAKQQGAPMAADPAPDQTPPRKRYFISSHELLYLAKAIVGSKSPTIQVPPPIIHAGLRAVSSRKRCANFFNKSADAKLSKQNHGHSYFISLMEEILLTLQPCFALSAGTTDQNASNDPRPSVGTLEDLENRFAVLEVEEPEEPQDDGPATSSETVSQPIYDLESPEATRDAEQDKLFAIFCLFDDLARLRSFVTSLWTKHKNGEVGLITASVTTNSAIQVAIRTQEEVLATYPDCAEYHNILAAIITIASNGSAHDGEEVFEMDDVVADWIYAPSHSFLDSFCDVLEPNQVPLMKRGHFGTYNPLTDRSKLDHKEQIREDLILLMELLPEFCFLAKYKIQLLDTDEFTRGLKKMALTKKIPVWLTFATTIFLDVHHILRETVTTAFTELNTIGVHTQKTLTRHFQFSQGIQSPSAWPKQNQQTLKEFARQVDEVILGDVIYPLKSKQYRSLDRTSSQEAERFYLFKRHPILCGILAFRLTLELQYAGVVLCNAWGTVIYPAHFYNALQQKTPPVAPWPMMDEVIGIHTEERVFVGAKPRTIIDCGKQICLMLGCSPEQFARNRRQVKPVISKNGPRGLEDTSPISEVFRKGPAGEDGRLTLTMHNVEKLLTEQALNEALSANQGSRALRQKWKRSHRLSPLQLLEALQASILLELPRLQFDYFHMHEQAITFLRLLRNELDADLQKYFGASYLENESQLPLVGLYAIAVAVGSSKAAETLGLSESGSKILEKAAALLEKFVDND